MISSSLKESSTWWAHTFLVTESPWVFSHNYHFLDDDQRDSYIMRSASPVNSSELYMSARASASLHFANGGEYSSLGGVYSISTSRRVFLYIFII